MSCPFCLSQNQSPIFLKNPKPALDSYFLNSISKNSAGMPSRTSTIFSAIDKPHFYHCLDCEGIFRNPFYILPEKEEHKRYFTHNNDLNDPNYIKYLSESIAPFLNFIEPGEVGLDFGCGPTKGIEYILDQSGIEIMSYDKYFFPNSYETTFDYIFCHEVVEHFVKVREEFKNLVNQLKPRGRLFIRTETHPKDFENWYYKNDSTHVFFFSEKTFINLALVFNLEFLVLEKNKFVLIKK